MPELTLEHCEGLVEKMRLLYGRKFDQQWESVLAHYRMEPLIAEFHDALKTMTPAELSRGMQVMRTKDWPPTVPEFARWCRPVSQLDAAWPTSDAAWAIALKNLDEYATFATCREIQQAWALASACMPDRFAARKAFVSRYEQLSEDAKLQGKTPAMEITLGSAPALEREQAIQHLLDSGEIPESVARPHLNQLALQTQRLSIGMMVATADTESAKKHAQAIREMLDKPQLTPAQKRRIEDAEQRLKSDEMRMKALQVLAERALDAAQAKAREQANETE